MSALAEHTVAALSWHLYRSHGSEFVLEGGKTLKNLQSMERDALERIHDELSKDADARTE